MSALTDLFTDIANAIRGKTGGTGAIAANDFASAIAGMPGEPLFKHVETSGGYPSVTIPEFIGKESIVFIGDGTSYDGAVLCGVVTPTLTCIWYDNQSFAANGVTWDKTTGTLTSTLGIFKENGLNCFGW